MAREVTELVLGRQTSGAPEGAPLAGEPPLQRVLDDPTGILHIAGGAFDGFAGGEAGEGKGEEQGAGHNGLQCLKLSNSSHIRGRGKCHGNDKSFRQRIAAPALPRL